MSNFNRMESGCRRHFGSLLIQTIAMVCLVVPYVVIEAFGQAPSSPPRESIQRGKAALEAGDFQRAIQQFEQAQAAAPDNIEVARGLLESYLQAGRPGLAIPVGRQATHKAPRDPQVHHWLGLAYFKTRQTAPARDELMLISAEDIRGLFE